MIVGPTKIGLLVLLIMVIHLVAPNKIELLVLPPMVIHLVIQPKIWTSFLTNNYTSR
jgi:hypothetical protein